MADETITEAELAEALLQWLKDVGLAARTDSRAAAKYLFEHVAAHREPEYLPGAAYEDANCQVWVYQPRVDDGGLCCWLKPGEVGVWSRGTPKRPLRRLIPEWYKPRPVKVPKSSNDEGGSA